jgi:hypothetical protein
VYVPKRRPLAATAPLLAAAAAAALAFGCAAAAPTTVAGAPAARTREWSAAAWPYAPPVVVYQGVGHDPTAFQATPRGTWIVDAKHGELVIIEPETANVVWRFPMHAIWPELIMSADGRYVAALARDQDAHETRSLLFAWDLARGRELFHRQVDVRDNRPGGILIGARTIHVAECEPSTTAALKCGFRDFDLATGAPRQPPPTGPRPRGWPIEDGAQWQPEPFPGSTQYSADGRLVLVPNRFASTIVYRVDPPALVTSLPGKCAELDGAGDLLWAPQDPAMVPAAQAALAATGVRLRVIPACPDRPASELASRGGRFVLDVRTPRPNDKADYARWITGGRAQWFRITRTDTGARVELHGFNETSSSGLYPRIGLNHDLLWERDIYEKPYQVFLQRADRAELPRSLPPLAGTARFGPAGAIVWGPDDLGRLRVMRAADFIEQPPGPVRIPGVGQKWSVDQFSPLLPDGRFLVATEGGRLAIALGPPTRVTRLPWVHITDGSTNVTFAGRRYLLVGDLKEGLLVVDLETQRRVAVLAKSEGEKTSDALPASDGASAWVVIGQRDPDADRIDQLSLPDGKRLASRRIPKLEWAGAGSFATFQTRTGWLEPDRRLWIIGGDYGHACLEGANDLCVITTIDLTTDPAGVRVVETPGTGHVTGAPDSSFFAQATPAQFGFNLFRADGATFLTTGAIGGGSYSFTPDGRFACTGDACRMLRCTAYGRSEPIDHPACRPLRREALSIDQELAGRGR